MPAPNVMRELAERYATGEYRARVFRDVVLADVRRWRGNAVVLDIGCGRGFDGDKALQESIASQCDCFIGLEPDPDIPRGTVFDAFHRCTLEEADIAPGSVNVAYSVMVVEHVPNPRWFFRKVYRVLRAGGVSWAFTVDGRHWFAQMSRLAEACGAKDMYLNWLRGRRGVERYDNYRTFYRANTPAQIRACGRAFRQVDVVSLHRVGQMKYYVPRWADGVARAADRVNIALRLPGSVLAARLVK